MQRKWTYTKSNVTATVTYTVFPISRFFKAFGTGFGSLESEKIIIGSPKSEKIGSLESEKFGPYRSIPGI